MYRHTVTTSQLATLLEASWIGADEGCIHERYSGRGMFGDTCVGVSLPRGRSTARVTFELAVMLAADDAADAQPDLDDVREILADLAQNERTDSMGLDTVVYWPNVITV